MAEFHFVRPYFLILLPLVLVLVINQLRAKSQGDWQKVMDKVLLSEIAKDNVEKSNIKAIKLSLFLGIALAVVAMAGPSWEKLPLPVFDTRDAKVFVLDLSPSMYSTDVTPSRVSRARHKLTDMIKRNQEGINALVVYAGSAHITSPLTDDVQTILNQISVLEPSIMPARGSHANEAIRVANQLFTEGQVAKGKVVLITDGNDAIPETAIEELRSKGHSLLVLAVGTEQGGPVRLPGGGFLKDTNGTIVVPKLESLEMSALARYAEGFSLIQSDQKDLDTLFANQSAGTISQENEEKEHNSQQWLERGPLLVLILIPFAFFLFRRDWLVCFVPVFLLAPSTDSYSMDWQSLWSNENQRAQQAYQDRDYEKASSLFTDGGWLGASQYRKGAYQKALTQFERDQSAHGHYNRGNTLAKLGKIDEAIAAYTKSIELDPQNSDAIYNKKLLEDLLKNQQGDSQSQPSQDQQQSDSAEQQQGQNQAQAQNQRQENAQDPQESENNLDQKSQQQSENNSDKEGKDEQQHMSQADMKEQESDQATEQWLRQIPDDPAGLLREKFRRQFIKQRIGNE